MKQLLKTIVLLLFVSTIQTSFAQTSNLSIQGILRTADGTAVEDGDYEVTFKLYLQANTGEPIWEETIENIPVKGGVYSVILGAGGTPLSAAFDEPYYLGVTVGDLGSAIELTPRARLTSSPYALSLIGDDNIFPNSGNVGVGAASPQSKLTVQRGNGTLGLEAIEDADNNTTITTKADGMEFSTEGASNGYYFVGEMTEVMRIKKDGKVNIDGQLGIGISDPQNTLHVVGDNEQVNIEGTDNANMVFTKNSGSATLGFDAAGGDDFVLSNSIGETQIEGNNIVLNTSSGTATIDGNTMINGNTTIASDGEVLKIVGVESSLISFKPKGEDISNNGYIGYKTQSWASINDLTIFNDTPSGHIRLRTNNGVVDIRNRVNIASFITYNGTHQQFDRAIRGNSHHWSPAGTYHVSLHTVNDIMTKGILLYSDERIKKDFKLSKGIDDLSRLQLLEVTDYRHVDVVMHGNEFKKGFIAQQVSEVYPEAVIIGKDNIPSIYAFPSKVVKESDVTRIVLNKPHQLNTGDRVKLVDEAFTEIISVRKIIDEKTFDIMTPRFNIDEKTFVYGKEVDDFHSVDYDRIYTLNVSATQELARQVETLQAELAKMKKENTQLKSANTQSMKTNNALKAEVHSLSTRMEAIEGWFNATGSK